MNELQCVKCPCHYMLPAKDYATKQKELISNQMLPILMPDDFIRVKKDGMVELPSDWCAEHSIDEGDWLVIRIEDNMLKLIPYNGPITEQNKA